MRLLTLAVTAALTCGAFLSADSVPHTPTKEQGELYVYRLYVRKYLYELLNERIDDHSGTLAKIIFNEIRQHDRQLLDAGIPHEEIVRLDLTARTLPPRKNN